MYIKIVLKQMTKRKDYDMCASTHANSKCCAKGAPTLVPLRHNNAERKILKAKRVRIQFIVIEYLYKKNHVFLFFLNKNFF